MLKILQVSLQQYVNQELPDVQAGFRPKSCKENGGKDRENIRNFNKNLDELKNKQW